MSKVKILYWTQFFLPDVEGIETLMCRKILMLCY